jgi:hypothetical protein
MASAIIDRNEQPSEWRDRRGKPSPSGAAVDAKETTDRGLKRVADTMSYAP